MGYPNLETIAKTWLATDLNTGVAIADRIRVENDPPGNRAYTARLVVVATQSGSPGDAQLTLDVTDLQVDCLAGDRDAAISLGELTRSALRLRFPGHVDTDSGASIHRVQTLAKPVVVPSGSSRLHQTTATYRITVHASGLS